MSHSLIYATAANREQALEIARVLVSERLVACVNLQDRVTSVYWWDGHLQEDAEALILAKTRSSNVSAVIAKIKELHSYSVPCITAIELSGGNPDYLDWITAETIPAG